jgi:hypothetical protein
VIFLDNFASCDFGLAFQILRLVFKKRFFNIEEFLSYLTFLPSKKTPSLIRVEKNLSKLGAKGIKRSGIFTQISKMCRSLASRSSQRFFSQKNAIYRKIQDWMQEKNNPCRHTRDNYRFFYSSLSFKST